MSHRIHTSDQNYLRMGSKGTINGSRAFASHCHKRMAQIFRLKRNRLTKFPLLLTSRTYTRIFSYGNPATSAAQDRYFPKGGKKHIKKRTANPATPDCGKVGQNYIIPNDNCKFFHLHSLHQKPNIPSTEIPAKPDSPEREVLFTPRRFTRPNQKLRNLSPLRPRKYWCNLALKAWASKPKAHSSAYSLNFPKRTLQSKRARKNRPIQYSASQHSSSYQVYWAQALIHSSKRKTSVPISFCERLMPKEISRQ